jgi:haloalkane dehalogenase
MKILQTPDARFKDLIDFPFKPNYLDVGNLRIHYVDEGKSNSEVILLMHGEPSWSFLYRFMIPPLIQAGFRVIAPDLVGFGRSDKPTEQTDHTYHKHVEWIAKWLLSLNLRNLTLFCQDWGSLIGLRVAIENQDRFKRIVLANGGLPTGEQQMGEAFNNWREFSRTATEFNISSIIQSGTIKKLSKNVMEGYDAPFPDDQYKAGARVLPSLVPISIEDPEHEANKKAIELFKQWDKPFLTVFSDGDPITKGGERFWQKYVPGAKEQNHTILKGAGHFLQEDKGEELAQVIIEFIAKN